MPLMRLAGAALFGALVAMPANAQSQASFRASSKVQGASFDLMATETDRFPSKSYLDVPGFHERPAPGARWLMCVYTALAVERGFTHWFVVYPAESSTRVVVGFTNSSGAKPQDVLGPDYDSKRVLGGDSMPVSKMTGMCGDISQYKRS